MCARVIVGTVMEPRSRSTSCLSENTFQQLLDGTLPDAQLRAAHAHLDVCRSCRELFSALAHALSAPAHVPAGPDDGAISLDAAPPPDPTLPGTRVGRFIVQGPLGAGGMGVVHAAEDPVLGRKVALKLIHAGHCEGPASEEWRVRLLREARSIARLSHPNVITVHDIGLHGDQLFVAMELVEGSTLRSWLEASPREWRDVLSVFVAAGRGLRAAHQAGLVHRDFKPDNILIGKDGQVRVTDFGLACPLDDADRDRPVSDDAPVPPDDALSALNSELSGRDGRLTRTGVLVGTPGYIAPEVLRGRPADIASDQFSFCVTLHEALFGERPRVRPPSPDDPAIELPTARVKRAVRAASHGRGVPGWLHQTVQRGLSWRPEDRYPSMDRLLTALDRQPVRRRRIQLGVGAALVAGGVAITAIAMSEPAQEPCTSARVQTFAIWNAGVSAQMQHSFAATGRRHAGSSAERVAQRIDLYTDQWAAMHRATCLATVRGEQSPDLLDRRLLCLGRRLDQVGALLDVFVRRADGDVVDRASALAGDLEPLSSCGDAAAMLSRVAPPVDPVQRGRAIELERQAGRAELERQAGRPQAAADAARAVLDAARALDYPPLAAQAQRVLGRSLEDLGRIADSRDALTLGERLSQRAGDVRLAVHLMIDLLAVVGVRQERAGEAQLLGQLIESSLERPELRGDEAMRARLLATLGSVATQERRVDRAVELQREVLAIRRRILPALSEDVASAEESLGVALRDKLRHDEARAHHFEALAIRRRLLGDEHPLIANVHINLGVTYLDQANPDAAREHLLAALAILERMPEYRSYHNLLNNLGELERTAGNYAQGRRYHEAALAVRLRQLGPDHAYVAISMTAIGTAMRNMGELSEAVEMHRRALTILKNSAGKEHPRYANCLTELGEDLRRLGRAEESLSYQKRALEIIRARSPEWDSIPLLHQGLALIDLGRGAEAVPELTRVHEHFTPGGIERARAAFALARALEPRRPTSARATALAQEALATLTTRNIAGERARVAAYLAAGPR